MHIAWKNVGLPPTGERSERGGKRLTATLLKAK